MLNSPLSLSAASFIDMTSEFLLRFFLLSSSSSSLVNTFHPFVEDTWSLSP